MESSQTDLEGKTVATPPAGPAGEGLVLCVDVKDIAHHTRGGGTNTIALFANLGNDDEGKRLGTVNLNLNNLKEAGLKAIAEALGIEELVDNTPLLVRIYVPTGALLEHWTQNRPGKYDDREA
jgi:hypothetical protein